jgi:hypothetical protein
MSSDSNSNFVGAMLTLGLGMGLGLGLGDQFLGTVLVVVDGGKAWRLALLTERRIVLMRSTASSLGLDQHMASVSATISGSSSTNSTTSSSDSGSGEQQAALLNACMRNTQVKWETFWDDLKQVRCEGRTVQLVLEEQEQEQEQGQEHEGTAPTGGVIATAAGGGGGGGASADTNGTVEKDGTDGTDETATGWYGTDASIFSASINDTPIHRYFNSISSGAIAVSWRTLTFETDELAKLAQTKITTIWAQQRAYNPQVGGLA